MKKLLILLLLLSACGTKPGGSKTCLRQTEDVLDKPAWEEPFAGCTIQLKIPKGWRCEQDISHKYAMVTSGHVVGYIAAPICEDMNLNHKAEWLPIPNPPIELIAQPKPERGDRYFSTPPPVKKSENENNFHRSCDVCTW